MKLEQEAREKQLVQKVRDNLYTEITQLKEEI